MKIINKFLDFKDLVLINIKTLHFGFGVEMVKEKDTIDFHFVQVRNSDFNKITKEVREKVAYLLHRIKKRNLGGI